MDLDDVHGPIRLRRVIENLQPDERRITTHESPFRQAADLKLACGPCYAFVAVRSMAAAWLTFSDKVSKLELEGVTIHDCKAALYLKFDAIPCFHHGSIFSEAGEISRHSVLVMELSLFTI
jgi:hypothetical protein